MSVIKRDKRDLIVNGNVLKALLLISLPLMFNNFFIASYNIIDTIFVSNIGKTELAVIAFISPLNNMMVAISAGIAIAGTGMIGREIGSENYKKANIISSHLFIISMVLGALIAIVLFTSSTAILKTFSATQNIINYGDRYFKLLSLSIPFVFFNSFYIAYKRGYGETVHIMNVQIFSMIVKVILNYYLIIVLKKQIDALAFTTLAGSIVISLYASYDLFLKGKTFKLDLKDNKLKAAVFLSIFLISLPVILERISMSYSFVFINKYVLKYGETVLSAYGITNRINSLFFFSIAGFGSGVATIVSQNLGAGKIERVNKSIKHAMFIGVGFSILFTGLIFLVAPSFAALLTEGDTVLYNHIMNAVHVYSASVIPWSIFQVIIGIFVGTSKTNYNLFITFVRIYALRLPCIIILTRFAQLNEFSIWYGMLISNILTAIFAFVLFRIKRRTIFSTFSQVSNEST